MKTKKKYKKQEIDTSHLTLPTFYNILARRRSSGKLFDNIWEIELRHVKRERKLESPKVFCFCC